MIRWVDPELAPKDGRQFLAVFRNYPGIIMTMWNIGDNQWVAATPQTDGDYSYFENEWFDEKDLEVWAEIKRGGTE